MPSMSSRALVVVVDDDESVRESLPDLLQLCGYSAAAFGSAADFLASDVIGQTDCLLLDVAMPGMSGVELFRQLARRGLAIPTIFITAHADAAELSRLLEERTVACVFKPFSEEDLLSALAFALGATPAGDP